MDLSRLSLESKEELDRFIEAMETIYDEIIEVAEGKGRCGGVRFCATHRTPLMW